MKIKELLKSITNNKYRLAILRGLALIGLITVISTISVHYLTGDTLSEYANNNPDVAYPTVQEVAPTESTIQEDIPEDSFESDTVDDILLPTESSGISLSSINISPMIHFYSPSVSEDNILSTQEDINRPDRINYSPGFYYEPLTDNVIQYITGTSYPTAEANPQVSLSELRYVGILYNDFNGLTQAGELICNAYIAQDLVEIFSELYEAEYQFDKIVLIDNYGGDDTASMCADNTSCFNYRVVEGKTSLSKHAYGLAIDINPFYNPYLVFGGNDDGSDYISPPGSEIYIDRSSNFAYKIDENDLCYKLFISHGFTWGGNWNSCKDYQHFQKTK